MPVDVIIPALNESHAIGKVIQAIPKKYVREIIVVDNGSTDETALVAQNAGASVVLYEYRKGYGSACLKGINYIRQKPEQEQPDVVVFIDADYSDYPEELPILIAPIQKQDYDLVIGSRALGQRETGSMTFPQIFGNRLATDY